MRVASDWEDFEVIDATDGEKLERWGNVTLVRPDPQVIWKTDKGPEWDKVNAHYIRSSNGGGHWEINNLKSDNWNISYKGLKFNIHPTGFKHTGLFPEQAVNWDLMSNLIKKSNKKEINVLNLFAYTGGATVACSKAGAKVVHVDAAKGMVSWARENAQLTGVSENPIRWIIDDCKKFIEREIRRGNKYDGIIMDPPSYGRGPNGEVWKLEDSIYDLVKLTSSLISDDALFFLLNSYTTGLSPSVMEAILKTALGQHKGNICSSEIGLPIKLKNMVLPQGSTAIWQGINL